MVRKMMNARPQPGQTIGGMTRRGVLTGMGRGAFLLGLSPLLGACSDGGDDGSDDGGGGGGTSPGTETQTLFFNLAHENHTGKTYYLTGGGRVHRLTPVQDKPEVLAKARRGNAFLARVPDRHITHHAEDVVLGTDTVTLLYVSTDIDATAGTWSMSSVYLQIPSHAAEHAFRQARDRAPGGVLTRSPKREMYGIDAATSPNDLREERALLDVNSHAAAIIGANPDLFSLEPNSAFHIHANHIDGDARVKALARALASQQYGPAMPEESAGRTNTTGWATLTPVIDDDSGQPFRNARGQHAGRVQYQPIAHPDIVEFASQAVLALATNVKDDTSLGVDITELRPKAGDPPNPALAGVMWARQDGASYVDQRAGATQVRDAGAVMTLKQIGPQNGLEVKANFTQSGGRPVVSLDVVNWYVRFLGVYLQFYDTNDPPRLLNLRSIPEYRNGTIMPLHPLGSTSIDTDTEMFIGVLVPMFTVLGIPTWPGSLTPSFTVPESVGTVRILCSGIGSGPDNYPGTLVAGEVMTGLINYGVTSLLCAVGAAASLPAVMSKAVVPVATALSLELTALINSTLAGNDSSSPGFWKAQGLALAKFLCGFLVGQALGAFVKTLAESVVAASTEAAAEDAIPVAGWIMFGISLAAGAANLIETSTEIALSPKTYVDDLVFTHDLSVQIFKDSGSAGPPVDPGNNSFPTDADHYVVTALFDDGTPHMQTLQLPKPAPATLPPVVFKAVPLGGTVNVSVAFYQSGTGTRQAVLLGRGSTGPIPNLATSTPSITIQELQFPLDSDTVYSHRQKTALDAAGNHYWDPNAAAPTVNSGNLQCGGAGTLCNFESITVRQGTATQAGYVGYVWQAENADPRVTPGCNGAAAAQLDQIANLNTGPGAQDGYFASQCSFSNPGVKLAYSLLSHDSANFYLDTSDPNNLYLRQLRLDPPGLASPGAAAGEGACAGAGGAASAGEAWGALNFMPDVLLLHPAGHFVSISNARHKMETLKVPVTAMADCDARVHLLAQLKSGKGSRPGLMTAPVAAAVAPDGTILVLQYGDPTATPPIPARIQAFDIGGNPIPFFTYQPSPYFLELSETPNDKGWQYLDLAVEMGGFVYVLSANAPQASSRLDVYGPTQRGTSPVSTTMNFNAAKIAVDFWRNLYALNYEVIPMLGGGTPRRTEPSISLWAPSNSCTGANC
jgi:hypothetical protein